MLKSFFKITALLAVLVSISNATTEVSEAVDFASMCGLVTGDNSIVNFQFGGGSNMVSDGDIVTATLTLNDDYHDNPPLTVGINAPGINCGRTTFEFDRDDPSTFEQDVTCRTDSGVVANNRDGAMVDIAMIFNYDFASADASMLQILQKICRKMLFKRKVGNCGHGGGWGDPHLTTLDRVNYDFQMPGVFRLFESRNLLVQVFQEKCAPVASRGHAAPSCYRGLAIAYAGSVAKLFIQNRRIEVGKGTSSLDWLSVERLKGHTDGYRIFIQADYATYVDVTLATWGSGYEYLNIALQASPYFKDPSVHGLLGNWNGSPRDDIRDNTRLAQLHGFPLTDNLFTCVGTDCTKFVSPASIKDEMARALPNGQALLHQGYTVVDPVTILLRAFTPALVPIVPPRALRGMGDGSAAAGPSLEAPANETITLPPSAIEAEGAKSHVDVVARAHTLCNQVMDQVPVCKKYVPNTAFYVDNLCIMDSVLLDDLKVVDNTKIAYLRECRRELDSRIEGNSTTVAEMKKMLDDRAMLEFGDLKACPLECSGQGTCLASGCECNDGFTGIGCEIAMWE